MLSFQTLIENSSDVISLVTASGDVLYTSQSSSKVFGYLPEELVGRNSFDLIHPEDLHHSRQALQEVLEKPPGPSQVEARVRRKNGQWCWVESIISNYLDEPQVAAIVVNCREIGDRRAAGEKKQLQADELTRCKEELEGFAYAIAHDLKEPLRTISMFTGLLVKDAQLDAHGKLLAHYIIDGAKRMSALLEGLHAFAVRGFEDPPQPVDLGHILAECLQDLGSAIATSGAIVTFGPLPWVEGKDRHLLRVFQNLIVNAIKYRSEAPVQIQVTAERLGADWIVKVKDNGIGIAPEHHEQVFGLLKRLHGSEIPGAGIGLAICKKIVEAMGGTIWVESKAGAGSTFCFTIAAVEQEAAVSALPAGGRCPNGSLMNTSTRAINQSAGGSNA